MVLEAPSSSRIQCPVPGSKQERGELEKGQGSAPGKRITYPLLPNKPPQNVLSQNNSDLVFLLVQWIGWVKLGIYSAPCRVSWDHS